MNTQTLRDLLPCPFCGSTDISSEEVMGRHTDGIFFKQTSCLNCGANGPESTKTPNDSSDDGWNKRVQCVVELPDAETIEVYGTRRNSVRIAVQLCKAAIEASGARVK